ncbi:MAG: hypothetical protein LBM28_06240 [Oscillospiraceae bacterium]|jgi:hypothetical protein|nr:hypothetical protein [Oscillospiraceae bacterium]
MKRMIALFLTILTLTACARNSAAPQTEDGATPNLAPPPSEMLLETENFKLIHTSEKNDGKESNAEEMPYIHNYTYYIYSQAGECMDEGTDTVKPPTIQYASESIVSVCFHRGTYAQLYRFYETHEEEISQSYWNPYLIQERLIVYYDGDSGKLIIRDIFNTELYYKEFSRDISTSAHPKATELSESELKITYYTPNLDEIAETISLLD